MSSRWDLLLEQGAKPVPLVDHLLDEVAKLLAKDLLRWPLPVEDLDLETGGAFALLVTGEAERPDPRVFTQAFRIAGWELERALEASSDYFRNRRWREQSLPDEARTAILFISRWLVEQLLSLREHTHSRITRPQLLDCLDRTRRRFEAGPLPG